jgi:hypothetical protein
VPCETPGCNTKSSQLSNGLRSKWASGEGLKWTWRVQTVQKRENRVAWFRFCEICHRELWPDDHRVNNRYSRPALSHWEKASAGGCLRLVAGDFYLTQPPPERASSSTRETSPPQPTESGPFLTPLRPDVPAHNAQAQPRARSRSPRVVKWRDGGEWTRAAPPELNGEPELAGWLDSHRGRPPERLGHGRIERLSRELR